MTTELIGRFVIVKMLQAKYPNMSTYSCRSLVGKGLASGKLKPKSQIYNWQGKITHFLYSPDVAKKWVDSLPIELPKRGRPYKNVSSTS